MLINTITTGLIAGFCLISCTSKKFRQGTTSMEPTIMKGEVIDANTKAYASTSTKRWDVVVFEPPGYAGQLWISRVVGLSGEVIDITPAGVSIDGRMIAVPGTLKIASYRLPSTLPGLSTGPVTKFPYHIPPNSCFLMGDNVTNALDSRHWGALPTTKIKGKVTGK